jgi:glycosyltransferase involved in cell wall biosynthesis
VVIPTFDRKALLLESIASVQRQTMPDLEVLVCDDGSSDDSGDAVHALGAQDVRVRWLPGPHCGYPGAVRNRGIRAARGEWIAFQDSDDLWVPGKLEKQLALARSAPDAQFIHSYAAAVLPDGTTRRLTPMRVAREGRVFETFLLYSFIATSTVLVRRALLERAGGFDEQMKLTVGEDYELFLRLAAETPFHFVPEELVLYRHQPDSATADLLDGLDQVERVLEATIRRFQVPDALGRRALAKIDLRRYKQHLLQAYPRSERLRDLQSALARDPGNAMARALMLAERMRCTAAVKTCVRLTENSAAQVY